MSVFARLLCSDISYFPLIFYLFFLITFAFVTAFIWPVIPACAGMTDIESGEISYRPWLLLVILANAVTHLKREDVLSRLNRRKACAQRLLRNGFPPARE
ncbi:hypothetical protein [Vibrio vulnificus YJ016]|uniref:Uncharacterized protein n=1 Tax=Vibrio vulnificus (strain YJ016) TaxID=196600 RepID=Q7MIB2_VIBVY|nr:hypothetical protein [Vibrio vulnificus YJ016]